MMAELNPVPFGRCRGRWRERRHQTVPTIGKSAKLPFAPVHVWASCRYNKPQPALVVSVSTRAPADTNPVASASNPPEYNDPREYWYLGGSTSRAISAQCRAMR